jgi:hypothetical protein
MLASGETNLLASILGLVAPTNLGVTHKASRKCRPYNSN